MKLSFFIGLVIVIVALFIGFLWNDYNITLKIIGVVIAGSVLISGILNGSFIEGDRYMFNHLTETKDDRDQKMKMVKYLLTLSVPSVIVFIIILVFN